jgi:hypothetical protein
MQGPRYFRSPGFLLIDVVVAGTSR